MALTAKRKKKNILKKTAISSIYTKTVPSGNLLEIFDKIYISFPQLGVDEKNVFSRKRYSHAKFHQNRRSTIRRVSLVNERIIRAQSRNKNNNINSDRMDSNKREEKYNKL